MIENYQDDYSPDKRSIESWPPKSKSNISNKPNDQNTHQEEKQVSEIDWLRFVDTCLRQAIDNYREIKMPNSIGETQPIFIDIIVKLLICRAFISNSLRKPLTADRFLNEAGDIIFKIENFKRWFHKTKTFGPSMKKN